MMLSVGRVWFGWLPLPVRPDYLIMAMAVVCAWWALLRLMLKLTSNNVAVVAFVAALGFLGTHLGFYSGSYSSEVASFFALSLLFYFAVGTEQVGQFEALLLGVTAGLSVVMRAQLALYVALPVLTAAYRVRRASGMSWSSARLAFIAALPCIALIVEAAYVNRWMTGNFLRNAYQFGDQGFQSVDWRRTEFLAVLLHPRHGLLAYHPLYLIGFSCLGYLALTAQNWRERALSCAALVVTLLHLYIQSAWYCWWLGTRTFGMRGMIAIAVLLLPALAVVLDRRQRAGRVIWPMIVVCVLCACWSLLLYFRNETNFVSWPELVKKQIEALRNPVYFVPTLVAAVCGVAVWLLRRKSPTAGFCALAGAAVAVTMAAAADKWVEQELLEKLHLSTVKVSWGWGIVVAVLTVGCIVAIALKPRARAPFRASEIACGTFALALVACASWQFARLARRTEAYVRERPALERKFEVTSRVLWDETVACYDDYLIIPGFRGQKERLLAYMERYHDQWTWVPRPRPRKPRRKRRPPRPASAPSSAPAPTTTGTTPG